MMTDNAAPDPAESRTGIDETGLDQAMRVIEQQFASRHAPSAVLALAGSSGPIVARAAGDARWGESPARAKADTIYLLASITKPFVATAVMQQVERGRLLLDDPVVQFIPDFAARGKSRITIRQLLSHTSGMDEAWYRQRTAEDPERYRSWESRLKLICDTPLSFMPGTAFIYCNPPFTILAEIVRLLSGQMIDLYLREHVYDPLELTDTSFDPPEEAEARLATVAGPGWPAPPSQPIRDGMTLEALVAEFRRLPQPAGGLWSTAADLVAFGRAHLRALRGGREPGARLLSTASAEAMLRNQTAGLPASPGGLAPPARGLGWVLTGLQPGNDLLSTRAFGHGGATGTQLIVDPARDLVIVFLTNRWGMGPAGTRLRSLAINAAIAATLR